MKCPVCKTECWEELTCPECGLDNISPTFISKEEGELWTENTVVPWRIQYWSTLDNFKISGTEIVEYIGHDEIVIIPYGIESIGNDAFAENEHIKAVYFPNTVKYICGFAFSAAFNLSTVVFSEGLECIEEYAFSHCNLFAVTIPSSCYRIGEGAFDSCYNLKFVYFLQGIRTIGPAAFAYCDVESIVLPESLCEIGFGAFSFQEKDVNVAIDPRNVWISNIDNCIVDSEKTIIAGSLHKGIPNDARISTIGQNAYEGGFVKNGIVYIPANIETIEKFAFFGCRIDKVFIPNTVKSIHWGAFAGVTNCNFFCEYDKRPKQWDEEWNKTKNSTVTWGTHWNVESGIPEILLLDKKKYSATLVSYEYDGNNDELKMWIRCKNKTTKTMRFVINSMKIDGDLCTCTHWGNIEANSEVRCKFVYEDTEFNSAFIRGAKEIVLDMCIKNEEEYILAKGEPVKLPGFYIPDENDENDNLPF